MPPDSSSRRCALQKVKLGADHPHTLLSMASLGVCYGSLGRHADQIKLREEILALQKAGLGPDHADTLRSVQLLALNHATFGDLLRGQGEFAEAGREYGEILRLKPYEAMGQGRLFCLGLTLEQHGKLREAEARYREVVRLDPRFWEVHFSLGQVLNKQGKVGEAEAEKKQVLRLNPDFADYERRGVFPVRRFLGHTGGDRRSGVFSRRPAGIVRWQ